MLYTTVAGLRAAEIDTLWVKSPSMKKDVQVLVISPSVKAVGAPVVYLLHGYSGNAFSWLHTKPELSSIADAKGLIIVCPDGANSWYWDSPIDSLSRYETFVAGELVAYVDSHYPTLADRSGRAITGLSMGGHGALWLSLRHKEVFGAAGSTSGGVDIRLFPRNWEMVKSLGEFETNRERWEEHTVVNQLDRITNGELALIIDCGEDDFFLGVNKDLHDRLLSRKIDHDFITRPGAHNGAYWNNALDYQLLFFTKYFRSQQK
jgi:S-formylglutathione hydrolase FrmB